MLLPPQNARVRDVHGLKIRDYGPAADGSVSVAVVEVPPEGAHPYAYSSRCIQMFFMLEGALRFDVDGIAYVARAGDVIVVPKGQLFQYFDWRGEPARALVVHVPASDETAEHVLPDALRTHDVRLTGERVVLRPMTEDDWQYVCAWNTDPEVMAWADHPDNPPRTPEQIREVYRAISLFAYLFIIECGGEAVGDCWLQKLNLPEIRERFPGRDLRRIDIELGRKDLWGKGLGTDAIKALLRFAFEGGRADAVYADVSPDNPRSRRAFEKAGFRPLEGADGLMAWRQSAD